MDEKIFEIVPRNQSAVISRRSAFLSVVALR